MSIATDVARIKGNITAALAAIADKGVTVPDGSTSDALAGLIASIEAGGGGGMVKWDGKPYVSFTFTLSEDKSSVFNVKVPDGCKLKYNWTESNYENQYSPTIIIYAEEGIDTYTNGQVRLACTIATAGAIQTFIKAVASSVSSSTYKYVYTANTALTHDSTINDNEKIWTAGTSIYIKASTNYYFVAGVVYRVVIMPPDIATNVEVF